MQEGCGLTRRCYTISMKLSHVQFETEDHLSLPGLLFEPEEKTKTAVIYLHGMGGSVFYGSEKMAVLAKEVTHLGISFFPFNNRGAQLIQRFSYEKGAKKVSVLQGSAYELIHDCTKDINAAVEFLREMRYEKFILIGHSTGANKICVYDYYTKRKDNPFLGYGLLSGGDDTGLHYQMLGKQKFKELLSRCRLYIKNNKEDSLVPPNLIGGSLISYRSLFDIMNTEGDYNTFPFLNVMQSLHLSKKPVFREFAHITLPTLIIYGENDEYMYGATKQCVDILKKYQNPQNKAKYSLIPDADHSYSTHKTVLAKELASWLATFL